MRISDWSSDVCSSDLRDDRLGQREAVARGQHYRSGPAAALALAHPTGDLEGARVQAGVLLEVDLDGPHEAVALVARVLAGGVGQLAGEAVLHALELLEIAGGEGDGEAVGHDGVAPDAERAVVVHLAAHESSEP